jgi:hypothetical protein
MSYGRERLPKAGAMDYQKHYVLFESDPQIFTALKHDLGASRSLYFTDVRSLDLTSIVGFICSSLSVICGISNDYDLLGPVKLLLKQEEKNKSHAAVIKIFKLPLMVRMAIIRYAVVVVDQLVVNLTSRKMPHGHSQ